MLIIIFLVVAILAHCYTVQTASGASSMNGHRSLEQTWDRWLPLQQVATSSSPKDNQAEYQNYEENYKFVDNKRDSWSKNKKHVVVEDPIKKARRQKIDWIRKCFFNPIGCT